MRCPPATSVTFHGPAPVGPRTIRANVRHPSAQKSFVVTALQSRRQQQRTTHRVPHRRGQRRCETDSMALGAKRHSPQLTGSCLHHVATFLLGSIVALLLQLYARNNLEYLQSTADHLYFTGALSSPDSPDASSSLSGPLAAGSTNGYDVPPCTHDQRAWTAQQSILVTGAAGFIGFHTVTALTQQPHTFVLGLDNFTTNYDASLKRQRQQQLHISCGVTVVQGDLKDTRLLQHLFQCYKFTHVVHLAAHAGVRGSLKRPVDYLVNNEVSTAALLEVMAQQQNKPVLVYASSSSVYGNNRAVATLSQTRTADSMQWSRSVQIRYPEFVHVRTGTTGCRETGDINNSLGAEQSLANDRRLQPMPESLLHTPQLTSVYAATKLATEHLVEVYTHQHNLKAIGLRFFTVYGPWGRPDMAVMKLAQALLAGRPVQLVCFPLESRAGNTNTLRARNISASSNATLRMQPLSPGNGDRIAEPLACRLPIRDFTYISDTVDGILLALNAVVTQPLSSHRVYNLGRGQPSDVGALLQHLENALKTQAQDVEFQVATAGSPDVFSTWAEITAAARDLGFQPKVGLRQGIQHFVDWYQSYCHCVHKL